MYITDKTELRKYYKENRLWQGIPGIEVTKKGRIYATFYSGMETEKVGNYVLLYKSDDGEDFGRPILVVVPDEHHRCFDPCLWIDPADRLWLIWSYGPVDNAVYAIVCNNPDADELVWSEERVIGHNVMMNKPVVLSTGEWLFPMAVWRSEVEETVGVATEQEQGSYVYKSIDGGETFVPWGKSEVPERTFDEHMVIELNNSALMMLVRTSYGIGVSFSYDRGKTWTEGSDSGIKGPSSRFCIRRLKSGRMILINHYDFKGRNNLAAMLSEDDGKTWKYNFILDERDNVSYPDLKEAEDGYIYVCYDRERGNGTDEFRKANNPAREILYAKITEEDIITGKLGEGSALKRIVNKLEEGK